MNRYLTLPVVAICCVLNAAQADDNCELAKLGWLNGSWQMNSENKTISEQWKTVSDKTMEGIGFTQKQDEEISSYETLRILEMSGELFLVARVTHNEMPVPFKASSCNDDSIVFVNEKHDFPNQLHYQLVNGMLLVDVRDNNNKGFKLTFTRKTKSPD